MSPTVPPTSTTITSAPDSSANPFMCALITFVTWGDRLYGPSKEISFSLFTKQGKIHLPRSEVR